MFEFISFDNFQVLLESAVKAEVYAIEKVTSGEAILQDMEISGNGKHIFILTPTKVRTYKFQRIAWI